jgi:hypothetical protein
MDLIRLAQDTDNCRAVVNTVTNLRFPQKVENSLNSWVTFSMNLLDGGI